MTSLGRVFNTVADAYDDARPTYPDELYDALERAAGSLERCRTLDLAAGTGIATRALQSRGADVVALDPGDAMVRRLRAVSPSTPAVVASAEQLAFRSGRFDLVTCATAWHWLDAERTVAEVRRVLRPGGHLALWWANNRWGDAAIEGDGVIEWEAAKSAVYERWQTRHGSRPPLAGHTGVGPREAAADLRARGVTVILETEINWTRERSREEHVAAIGTHSDVLALGDRRGAFLDEVSAALAPWPIVIERLWGPLVVARF